MGNSADGSRNGVRVNGTRVQRNPDRLAPGCVRLLEEAGFTYDRQIGAWLNIRAGRVITFDRVANRSPEWLAAWLRLSPTHPLFIANGHDVRTVRFRSPAPVPLCHESIKLTAAAQRVGLPRSPRPTASTMARRLH